MPSQAKVPYRSWRGELYQISVARNIGGEHARLAMLEVLLDFDR
jgi:hypothetical protein